MTGSLTNSIFSGPMPPSPVARALFLCTLVLPAGALDAGPQAGGRCGGAAGGAACSAPGFGSELARDDAGLEPAVDLLQKAVWDRRKDPRTREVPLNASDTTDTQEHLALLNRSGSVPAVLLESPVFRVQGRPCSALGGPEESAPRTATSMRADLLALRELGLVSASLLGTSQCEGDRGTNTFDLHFPQTVEEKNRLATFLIVGWCFIAGGVIVYSIWSLAMVPRKPDREELHAKPLNLADEESAFRRGFLNWIFLSWADDFMGRYGKCWHSVIDDRELVRDRMDEEYMPYLRFRKFWQEECEAKGIAEASILWPLLRVVGFWPCFYLVVAIVVEVFMVNVGMVIALDKFLGHLEWMEHQQQAHPGVQQSYLEATLMVLIYVFGVPMVYRTATILVHILDGYYTNVCGSALASIVFEKALSMPVGCAPPEEKEEDKVPGYYEQNNRPNVVQLLNVDIIECWAYLMKTMVYIAVSPLLTIVLFVMLIQKIKLAGFIGVLYIIPCTMLCMQGLKYNIALWMRYQGFQDERLRWLTESMIHIRTIKSLAWERLSYNKLHKVRTMELDCNQKCAIVGGAIGSIGHTMPWGTMLLAAFCALRFEGYLQAHTIIIIQRLMSGLLAATLLMLDGTHKFVTVPNAFRRVRKFLMEPDLPKDVVHPPALLTPNAPVVCLRGSFSYVEGKKPVLEDLDISINRGEFVAVIGAMASGKSALFQTVLGELYPVDNDSYIEAPPPGKGQVAFCSQVPWIFEGTLKENVLLKAGLSPDRYYSALYAASLMQDLEILPGGDQVTIGSYGIRLSGGQRARVALARAAYQEQAHLVLIDDPFASVDVPTGNHICTELLLGPLMRGRTRIVAMQPNPVKLRYADRVILLEAGRVAACGSPEEVIASPAFQDLMAKSVADPVVAAGNSDVGGHQAARESGGERTARICERKATESPNSLRDEEAQDHVTWATCVWWFRAAGLMNLGFFLLMLFVQRWVSLWEALAVARWVDMKVIKDVNDEQWILYVIGVVCINCVVLLVAAWAASRLSLSASTLLHSTVLQSILRAPIDKFFDKQPVGRLINRLSFDMRKVDDAIVGTMVQLLGFVIGFIVTESFILRVVPWRIAVGSIPVFLASFYFIYIFRGTAVPLVFHTKFALSNLQDLGATVLTSCVSIRANSMCAGFMQRFNHHSASVVRCNYLIYHVCACWVQSRVFFCFATLTCIFACGGLWANMPLGTLAAVIAQQFSQMSDFEALSGGFTNFLNILNALQRLTKFFSCPQEAVEYRPGDIEVRKHAMVPRSELALLEVRTQGDAEAAAEGGQAQSGFMVCLKSGAPVLRSTPDGTSLVVVEGRRLLDIAPGCTALQDTEGYHIVAVNSVSRHAERMAQELANPPATVWIDLWHSRFSQGMRVQIDNLTAGYCNEKTVLHGICVDIAPRMKMGFAGQTGCGKSTTMLCLLRLLEPRGGVIRLGGMDTSALGLATLRKTVGLVPQDPTIFEGTLRSNVDPFDEFPDGRLWEALKSMQLLPFVRSQRDGINSPVAKEGGNMSFGQRQLLSLARMVVRQPPVLLLDECTSALDPYTQEVVQKTILHDFPMTTVIAIAHRVETILDFDKVTVLDQGHVVEQGTITEVLQLKKGIFSHMVKASKPEAGKP